VRPDEGQVTPGSDAGPTVTAVAPHENKHESNAAIFVAADSDRKHVATLTARLALRSIELRPLPSGGFVVACRGAFTTLDDLAAVEDFARRVGA
jgi:predicted dinucleotide-binding enzyme